jgi:glycosyltransferase involved in cell wall biosynthesis
MGDFISVILPCRNEERTVGECIRKINKFFWESDLKGEIIVSDSSKDDSAEIARRMGVKVIKHDKEGYGYAYQAGIKHAQGNIIIIGDADNTYDFSEMPLLLEKANDNDLVIGSRVKGNIHKGAMKWLHRYIGNPLLSLLLRILFGSKVSDTQSGFRLIKRQAWDKLKLQTRGMEFASEMIIKAAKLKLKVAEVPINYYPRATGSESKLRSFSDGWKHLRFMTLFTSFIIFLLPALIMILGGIFLMIFYQANMLLNIVSLILIILGYQLILLGLFAKTYAATHLKQKSRLVDFLTKYLSLTKGIIIGIILALIGIGSVFLLKKSILLLTFLILSLETLSATFIMSIIGIEEK